MRLQDLVDDLACWNVCQTEVTPAGYEVKDSPALAVARRVAALYETCDGWGGADCLGSDCRKCEGSLIVATPLAQKMTRDPLTLADYLFGEDR